MVRYLRLHMNSLLVLKSCNCRGCHHFSPLIAFRNFWLFYIPLFQAFWRVWGKWHMSSPRRHDILITDRNHQNPQFLWSGKRLFLWVLWLQGAALHWDSGTTEPQTPFFSCTNSLGHLFANCILESDSLTEYCRYVFASNQELRLLWVQSISCTWDCTQPSTIHICGQCFRWSRS